MSRPRTVTFGFMLCLLGTLALAASEDQWVRDVRSARNSIARGDIAVAEATLDFAGRSARLAGSVDGRLPAAYEALAEWCRDQQLADDAIRASRMAVSAWKDVGGANLPRVAAALTALARMEEKFGRWEEAEDPRLEAVRWLERHYGPEDAAVAGGLERLARHYAKRSLFAEAELQYQRAFRIATGAFGLGNPLILLTVRDYAAVLRQANRPAEAVELESLLRNSNPPAFGRGDWINQPSLKFHVAPEYSEEARIRHIEGTVVLTLVVDETGAPSAIRVREPIGYGLDDQAVNTVSQWRFTPAEKDGRPLAAVTIVEIRFNLL